MAFSARVLKGAVARLPTIVVLAFLALVVAAACLQCFNLAYRQYSRAPSTYTAATLSLLSAIGGVSSAAQAFRRSGGSARIVSPPALVVVAAAMTAGWLVFRDGFSFALTTQGCFTNLELWLGMRHEDSWIRWSEQVVGAVLLFGAPILGFLPIANHRRPAA